MTIAVIGLIGMRPKSRGRSVWSARSLEGAGLLARGWGGGGGGLRRALGGVCILLQCLFQAGGGDLTSVVTPLSPNSCLLLIITLRFTCCEKKIWFGIKKFLNIMSIIVE